VVALRAAISGQHCCDVTVTDYGRYEIARPHPDAIDSTTTSVVDILAVAPSSGSEYLIQFRGLNPPFRYDEFMDAYHLVLKQLLPSDTGFNSLPVMKKLRFFEVIPDTLSEYPIGAYVRLPSSRVASLIASRCAMVRRVIEVWGDGSTMIDACAQALANYPSIIYPMLCHHEMDRNDTHIYSKTRTWWVHFERYGRSGRSGLDVEGKRLLLSHFQPLFQLIDGSADSFAPTHELIYLEDWHSYQRGLNGLIADRKAMGSAVASDDMLQYASSYSPHRCVWGRILAIGPSIVNTFDLRQRPFVGTTSMNALSAHLCANAAHIEAGQMVLDPFCGTGSLLVAAAHLGAEVVGSDIDADCLGRRVLPSGLIERSKNARFKRKNGESQLDKSSRDNFVFYNLEHKLLDLIGVDASRWEQLHTDDCCDDTDSGADYDGRLDDDSEVGLIKKYDKVSYSLVYLIQSSYLSAC